MFIDSPTLQQEEEIRVKDLAIKSHFSSKEVNDRVHHHDGSYVYNELTIITDEAVTLTQQADAGDTINLVATNITNNVEQHVHNLTLESTQGNIEVNKAIAGDTVALISEKNVSIQASLKGQHELDVVAKGDILVGQEKKPAQEDKYHRHSAAMERYQQKTP